MSETPLRARKRRDPLSVFLRVIVWLAALITVGVFVANAVVAYRRARAKRESDAILDEFAGAGAVDETSLPELEKRYLFFGGRRTLWDIALRSVGRDVPLPHPFAPRKLTWKERLTGELEE